MKICNLKIDVSCEASVNFQHIAQNATTATEFAPCRHLTQPCQCDLQKTRNTTRLKCCACHEKWRWTRRKCCAWHEICHEICHASSLNVAKVLRLPHKTTFDTLQNVAECHEVPRLPRETKQPNVWNLQKWSLLQNFPHIGTAIRSSHERLRTVANGCGRFATVNATSSEHTLNPQTPRVKREPLLRIRELCKYIVKILYIYTIKTKIYIHCARCAGITFQPADEDGLRRRIAKTNSSKTHCPPKTNSPPKTDSEEEFHEDELPPEGEFPPEDEFRRRIPRRGSALRRRSHPPKEEV